MALEGQVSYLSTEFPGVLQRPRTPRRTPGLRINQEDEEEINDGRTSPNLGMRAPIIGYEVVDERQKFTVYKIEVKGPSRSWFVFRRYTDFTRLNDRLKDAYPNFQIRLPGKRWFKDNFDPEFIEERAKGLQFFINNVMNHAQICQSAEVEEFFCLHDPPGPYDSLEESRAYCQHLENEVGDLKRKVEELQAELKITKSQLVQARVQQEALVSALRIERALRKKGSVTASKRSSADVDELLEQSEKMANVDGLRGKIYDLMMPKSRSDSSSKMATLNGNEGDKVLWNEIVDIAEHSSGAARMRSSKLVRRQSREKQSPLTSTPVSNSDRGSPRYMEDSQVDETKKGLTEIDNTGGAHKHLSSTTVESAESATKDTKDTKEEKSHNKPGNLTNVASVGLRKHGNKRDSGISVDTSPTPST
ncbi:sorting nexin-16-like [Montipora capricornis]|uniref:sorting nexin-16-like n=1 Tax=Montipora capricornis TaxID=246305 RepID=UPI0035F1C3A5